MVPKCLLEDVLAELHWDHLGIVKMKAVARSHMWWPGIDKALERMAKTCSRCQAVGSTPATAPLHPWAWPSRPWQRIHIDYGPFRDRMFFVLMNAYSKWPEVVELQSVAAAKTIKVSRQLFARYGLPEQFVSDNGSQFTSEEFEEFMKRNGIKHTFSALYHPATNGLTY